MSSAASWLAGRISGNRGMVSGDASGTGIWLGKRGSLRMRRHWRRGSVAQQFVSTSGIDILVSGGRRCRRHLHCDERRAASAMLFVN
jgi:hypothetical protein